MKECFGVFNSKNNNKNKNKLDFTHTIFGQKNLIQKYKDLVGGKQVDKIIDDVEMNSVGQWIGLFSNFIEVKIANHDQEVKD